jgi:hypothetical protein
VLFSEWVWCSMVGRCFGVIESENGLCLVLRCVGFTLLKYCITCWVCYVIPMNQFNVPVINFNYSGIFGGDRIVAIDALFYLVYILVCLGLPLFYMGMRYH